MMKLQRIAGSTAALLVLAACGAESERYAIGGSVSGLSSAGLVLTNNGASSLAVSSSGTFVFPVALGNGAAYAVTVQSHPDGQACAVANGAGTVNAAAITTVNVTCSAAAALTIASISPPGGSTNVARTIAPALTFSSAPGATVNPASITLQAAGGAQAFAARATGNVLTVSPSRKLLPMTTYTLTATGVRGVNGEQQIGTATTSFSTRDATWQSQEQLLTDSEAGAFLSRIGMSASGNAVALWLQDFGLWTRYYTPASGWGPAERVQNNADDAPRKIVMDASGNAIGVWEIVEPYSCSNEDGCSRHILRVRNYTVSGGWGGFRTIASSSRDNYMNPQLEMNSSGTAELVWNENADTNLRIYAKRYTRRGGWEATQGISPDADYASSPQVAVNEAGDAIVVWMQLDGTASNIAANRHLNDGDWTGAVLVENDNAGQGSFPELVMDAQGNAVVVWPRYLSMETSLWWSRFSPVTGWSGGGAIGNGTGSGNGGMELGVDAGGNVMLVYVDYDFATTNPTDADVSAIRFVANAGWGNAVRIGNVAETDQRNPLLAVDASGNALATWTESDGTLLNSWSNRYTPNAGWGTPVLIENFNAGNAFVTFLEADASGDILGFFTEITGPDLRSYTKRFE